MKVLSSMNVNMSTEKDILMSALTNYEELPDAALIAPDENSALIIILDVTCSFILLLLYFFLLCCVVLLFCRD